MVVVKFQESDSDSGDPPLQNGGLGTTAKKLLAARQALPLYQSRRDVVDRVLAHQVTVLVGETGSGKSTQLPQALLERDPKQRIVVSQPRRVAAISLATRVAAEAGTQLGDRVGYQVRFQSRASPRTTIKYVTDGMLLREFLIDPQLRRYTTVIVDEAHERTVVSDLVLGLLKALLPKRKDLRVVVMSATIDAGRFAEFFGPDTVKLYVPGRAFPVDRFYLKAAVASVVDAAAVAVGQINAGEPAGDILVFLPGQEEIDNAIELVKQQKPPPGAPKIVPLPLYASLPEPEQQKAFAPPPPNTRKVVFATNIAETSVTIPGVRYVVDSGVRKIRQHRAKLGLDSLLPGPVSQASAAQRAGRAGREGPGRCWRLYTEGTYVDMEPHTEPEIKLVNIAGPILLLKCAGVEDPRKFDWLDPPAKTALHNALLLLYSLQALDSSGKITPRGREMAVLPLDPSLAAVLVVAKTLDAELCGAVLDVAACLSVQDLFSTPPSSARQAVADARAEQFPQASQWGDLVLMKLVWDSYVELQTAGATRSDLREWARSVGINFRSLAQVAQVRQQLVGYLRLPKESPPKKAFSRFEDLIKSFLVGYVSNTALALPDRRFQTTVNSHPVSIHPGSALFGQRPVAIMYLEYVYTSREYARIVSPIEVEWLRELAPHILGLPH